MNYNIRNQQQSDTQNEYTQYRAYQNKMEKKIHDKNKIKQHKSRNKQILLEIQLETREQIMFFLGNEIYSKSQFIIPLLYSEEKESPQIAVWSVHSQNVRIAHNVKYADLSQFYIGSICPKNKDNSLKVSDIMSRDKIFVCKSDQDGHLIVFISADSKKIDFSGQYDRYDINIFVFENGNFTTEIDENNRYLVTLGKWVPSDEAYKKQQADKLKGQDLILNKQLLGGKKKYNDQYQVNFNIPVDEKFKKQYQSRIINLEEEQGQNQEVQEIEQDFDDQNMDIKELIKSRRPLQNKHIIQIKDKQNVLILELLEMELQHKKKLYSQVIKSREQLIEETIHEINMTKDEKLKMESQIIDYKSILQGQQEKLEEVKKTVQGLKNNCETQLKEYKEKFRLYLEKELQLQKFKFDTQFKLERKEIKYLEDHLFKLYQDQDTINKQNQKVEDQIAQELIQQEEMKQSRRETQLEKKQILNRIQKTQKVPQKIEFKCVIQSQVCTREADIVLLPCQHFIMCKKCKLYEDIQVCPYSQDPQIQKKLMEKNNEEAVNNFNMVKKGNNIYQFSKNHGYSICGKKIQKIQPVYTWNFIDSQGKEREPKF